MPDVFGVGTDLKFWSTRSEDRTCLRRSGDLCGTEREPRLPPPRVETHPHLCATLPATRTLHPARMQLWHDTHKAINIWKPAAWRHRAHRSIQR